MYSSDSDLDGTITQNLCWVCMYVCMYECIEVALRGDAHGIGRSNWAKGRDPSCLWVQYPNPAVPPAPRHSRWIIFSEPTLL